MTDYIYDKKHLGAGTIGGRGWWLTKRAMFPNSVLSGASYNTNLQTPRPLLEATTFNEKVPPVEPSLCGRLEFIRADWDMPALLELSGIVVGAEWPVIYQNIAYIESAILFSGRFDSSFSDNGANDERHAHRVLFNNIPGMDLLSSAARIQIGNSGYTDTLPGLFIVQPVAGSIVPGVSCDVTIKPADDSYDHWMPPHEYTTTENRYNYGSISHPYLRDENNPVAVSLVTDNHNRHVIPGLDIRFVSTPLDSSKAIISIGYEYANRWTEVGDFGDIYGRTDYFLPMCNYGLTDNIGPVALDGPKGTLYRWRISNVSGALQNGCQFHVRPLIRLDQGNETHPFDQWFMGVPTEGDLPKTNSGYVLTFLDFTAGTPNTVTLHCNYPVDLLIQEISPATYVPTGNNSIDGSGLKCDGETLYLWPAAGVYFVLSADLVAMDTATIRVAHGDQIERIVSLASDHGEGEWVTNGGGAATVDIGGVDAITDDEGAKYPASAFAGHVTGKIQTQGHDYGFINSSVHPTQQHWYNHGWEVCVYPGFDSTYNQGAFSEFVVMVTCDDPRYFQVIPMAFQPATGGTGTENTETLKGSVDVLGEQSVVEVAGSANIMNIQPSLAIRVNQLQPDHIELLAAHGVTIESGE